MRFGILGPVVVWRGDTTPRIGGPREKKLLAALLLAPRRTVPLDRLITVLWDDEPPATSRAQVHNCAAALRRNLGVSIRWESAGLVIAADDVDTDRFQALVGEADELVAAQRLPEASARLREALALWRGPALAGVDCLALAADAERLEAQRLACLERRLDVDLELARHRDLIGELTTLVAEQPLQETLHAKLMLALYRSGRRADALDAYHRARKILADELGLEPSTALAEMESMILRDDPALRLAAEAPVPRQLPADTGGFTGREAELDALDAALDRALVLITGPAGIGKTSLAVHWAHRVADRFADGQLHVDLRGHSRSPAVAPADALGRFLRALGVAPESIPLDVDEAAATFRTRLAGRRVMVLLDNAGSADQIRPLLPGEPGCLAVVTSRHRLAGLVAKEGGHRIEPAHMSTVDALALLRHQVGADRIRAQPDAAAELVRLCGGLPLALRIAAAAAAGRPLAEHVERLRDDDRLGGLSIGDDDQADVRRAFELSYTRLSPQAQRLFGLLGAAPGEDFALPAIAAVAGTPRVRPLVDELISTHLVEHRGGRFGFHDLLRLYAEQLAPRDDTALTRLLDHYLNRAEAAARALYPERLRLPTTTSGPDFEDDTAAAAWLDAERANLVAAVRRAPADMVLALANGLRGYLELRRLHGDWRVVADAALDAANSVENPRAPAAAALISAAARFSAAAYDLAELEYQRALELARTAGWLEGQAEAHSRIGVVLWETERLSLAVEHLREARELTERTQDRTGQAAAWHNLAVLYWHLGELDVAADHFAHGLELYWAAKSVLGEGMAETCLGGVLMHLGRHAEAHERLSRALALNRRLGNHRFEALALGLLALVHRDTGDLPAAVAHARSAVLVADDLGLSRERVDVLNMAGTALVSAGFPDEARRHLDTAHEIAQLGTPYLTGVVQARQGLADVCLATGDATGARALAEESLIPSRRAGYRMQEGAALITLAQAALAEGNRGEAARLAAQAEAVLGPTGYRYAINRARAVRASAS